MLKGTDQELIFELVEGTFGSIGKQPPVGSV